MERRAGCFELAHEGSIFLDEIGEMSPATQAKFLRILQDGVVRRLGGKAEITVDARVIAATNKDPQEAMRAGNFRDDLYYRLNVVTIHAPPLKERREDVPLLVEAFIEEFNAKYDKHIRSVDPAALDSLMTYDWPGNVRELRNTIERASIVCTGELIGAGHLPPAAVPRPSPVAIDGPDTITFALGTNLDEAEKGLILKTLARNGNNKTQTAQILGISLKTLHNKLRRYGL
jgi:transcriptional regulator with PAS, ATPase and Fis domain